MKFIHVGPTRRETAHRGEHLKHIIDRIIAFAVLHLNVVSLLAINAALMLA